MCAHQWRRCSPTRDGSREEDEDNEVEEVGSPQKRKWASTDEGSWDKKGKRKMTEVDWEVLRLTSRCSHNANSVVINWSFVEIWRSSLRKFLDFGEFEGDEIEGKEISNTIK